MRSYASKSETSRSLMAFGGRRGINWRITRGITEPHVKYYTTSNQKVSRLIVSWPDLGMWWPMGAIYCGGTK